MCMSLAVCTRPQQSYVLMHFECCPTDTETQEILHFTYWKHCDRLGDLMMSSFLINYRLVSFLGCCKEGALRRLYNSGSKLSEGAVMAADASLSLERVSGAMHAMFDMLSKPDILPEFNALQV